MSQNLGFVKRLLKVAIVGSPNAGKSTLINKLIRVDLNAVSNKVHTTRRNCLGVLTHNETQIEFIDSPGLVTRDHLIKHRLEYSLFDGAQLACQQCDLIGVLVDASNPREQRKLNKGVLKLLREHSDNCKSILILNKIDLVKDKRKLIDIGVRLTQGCLNGELNGWSLRDMKRLTADSVDKLNLNAHIPPKRALSENINDENGKKSSNQHKSQSKYVIELDQSYEYDNKKNYNNNNNNNNDLKPDDIGYKYFSQVHSISALTENGLEILRDSLIEFSKPVDAWPHGPDYVSDRSNRNIVDSIIRGKVMDYVDKAVPYLLDYQYLSVSYDELGSLNVNLRIKCPKSYMISQVLGKHGININRVVDESRELIAKNLACDVKLNIEVV